jgi:hypothetical protein
MKELVDLLVSRVNVDETQASGGAAVLLKAARERLGAEQFGALLGNVAGIDDLIKLAPAAGGAGRLFGGLASALGGSQGALLANIVGGFSQLGLTPDHAKRFAPVMLDFVRSHAGADAAAQLEAALRAGR